MGNTKLVSFGDTDLKEHEKMFLQECIPVGCVLAER